MSGIHTSNEFAILVSRGKGVSLDSFANQKDLLASAARRVRSTYGDQAQIDLLLALIEETKTLAREDELKDAEPCPECRENGCDGVCMEIP